jgi:hypothetical protein
VEYFKQTNCHHSYFALSESPHRAVEKLGPGYKEHKIKTKVFHLLYMDDL